MKFLEKAVVAGVGVGSEDELQICPRELTEVMDEFQGWTVVVVAQLHTFINIHQTMHLKWMSFMVCKLWQ